MARPQRLSEAQIAELFDPPTEQRDLVRHFTLSEADLGAIRRCRGDHNRLGYALMLCYLRHPGRARLYSFGRPSDYPTLEPLIAGRINVALIRAHWSEILRIIASLRAGAVTASLIMRQLASYPRQNGVAAALRELGRLERTLFTLDWIEDPELRRTTGQELNKGEARNSLARAVFIHRLGEIRDRTYENQQHRASGLNLLVTAIILWNTRYLERAVATLRQTEDVPDYLLAHLSPLGWEHVNLTGDYVWGAEHAMSKNNGGLRPLRTSPAAFLRAA